VGRSLTYQSHGFARTNANAPAQNFLSSTKIPVASVSKVVTALAAIRVLGKHNISLDAAIGGYFPSDWSLGTNVAAITFRELLSHTSGITVYGNTAQDYADIKQFYATVAINPLNKVPNYSNYNFSVFRILLPIIDGFVDDPANRPAKLAAAYIKIAQTNVFEPVGVMNVDAKAPSSGPQASAYAYSYAFPGTSGGWDWGDHTLSVGHAGWYLSVEDIAHVLVSLNKNDGKILTAAQLQAMETKPLGWDTKTDATGYGYVEKNGGWSWNGTSLSTSIALFGPGVIGVLFMNSDISGEPGVGADTVLREAYMKGLKPRP
jgi:CubicO group peptidase (beta-lactamase class C family)